MCKIFADDNSFFSKFINTINSENTLNDGLKYISNQAYQWKMQLNHDPKKQANEVIFSRKSSTASYPPVNLITTVSLNVRTKSTWVLSLILNQTLVFILNIK